jgi:hypothetical protein
MNKSILTILKPDFSATLARPLLLSKVPAGYLSFPGTLGTIKRIGGTGNTSTLLSSCAFNFL